MRAGAVVERRAVWVEALALVSGAVRPAAATERRAVVRGAPRVQRVLRRELRRVVRAALAPALAAMPRRVRAALALGQRRMARRRIAGADARSWEQAATAGYGWRSVSASPRGSGEAAADELSVEGIITALPGSRRSRAPKMVTDSRHLAFAAEKERDGAGRR